MKGRFWMSRMITVNSWIALSLATVFVVIQSARMVTHHSSFGLVWIFFMALFAAAVALSLFARRPRI
jgi:hypothetical protein